MTADAKPLAGLTVLVTRPPAAEGGGPASLAEGIRKHGGEAVVFPVLEIAPPEDGGALLAALRQLEDVDLLIFVSVHAVHGVGGLLKQHRLQIPDGVRVAAVGPATAAQCERASIAVDYVPRTRIDSEGLLEALRHFDAAGRRVLIFRGQSGRELLKRELEARGADVRYVESYRRRTAAPPPAPLLRRWRANGIDMVVITSNAVMDALREILGPAHRGLADTTPVCAAGRRVAEYCRQSGVVAQVWTAAGPADACLIEALIAWRKQAGG